MIARIEEVLGKLLSDPSAAVREAASGSMDRTFAKRSLEAFRSRILGGTVEEKLRAIYAAADLGGSDGVSLLLQALSDRDAEIRGAAVRALSSFPSPGVIKSLWEMLPRESGVVLGNLLETLGAVRAEGTGPARREVPRPPRTGGPGEGGEGVLPLVRRSGVGKDSVAGRGPERNRPRRGGGGAGVLVVVPALLRVTLIRPAGSRSSARAGASAG